jgi:hypothetical protein
MPELGWYFGYPLALLLMALSSFCMFAVINRTGGLTGNLLDMKKNGNDNDITGSSSGLP